MDRRKDRHPAAPDLRRVGVDVGPEQDGLSAEMRRAVATRLGPTAFEQSVRHGTTLIGYVELGLDFSGYRAYELRAMLTAVAKRARA